MAVTSREIFFYDSIPWTKEAWSLPVHIFPLIHTRLVQTPSSLFSNSLKSTDGFFVSKINELITFTLRIGTRQGVEIHVMKTESRRDLSKWARQIIQRAHLASLAMKEASFGNLNDK